MPKKILVINGHASKARKKMQLDAQNHVMSPGDIKANYHVDFDNQDRHLEEMTYQDKIWPVARVNDSKTTGMSTFTVIQWHRYQDTSIDDIEIEPLQGKDFNLKKFVHNLLTDNPHAWSILTQPAHDVLLRGALAVQMPSGEIVVYENTTEKQVLTNYLTKIARGHPVIGTPMFFCDKELGKVKPLGLFHFSEMYQAIGKISEFKIDGTDIILATCNATQGKDITQIQVITTPPKNKAGKETSTSEVTVWERPVAELVTDVPPRIKKNLTDEQILKKAADLLLSQKIEGKEVQIKLIMDETQPEKLTAVEFKFNDETDRAKVIEFLDRNTIRYLKTGDANSLQISSHIIASSNILAAVLKQTEKQVGSFSSYQVKMSPEDPLNSEVYMSHYLRQNISWLIDNTKASSKIPLGKWKFLTVPRIT